MTMFYRRLGQSKNNAAALREAVIELRERYSHPYYWAPFVLVGKALSGNLGSTK
jgi:CHAT domain-containing protein